MIKSVSYTHLDVYKRQIPLYGLIIAFEKYNPAMGFGSPWVGWSNFEYLFRQPNFVRTIWNTLYIAVMKICLLYTSRCV